MSLKKKSVLSVAVLLVAMFAVVGTASAAPVTHPGPYVLDSPSESMHLDEVWDLTAGDLTLEYTIDLGNLHQPPNPPADWKPWWWDDAWGTYNGAPEYVAYYWSHTVWTEVGMRGVGAPDFNPGPPWTYQGKCGGWMVHDPDAWLGEWVDGELVDDNQSSLDMDDKISLQASSGRDEKDYDVLAGDPDTVLTPFGSGDNYGIWFDRDGVDPWQDNDPLTPAPGGSAVSWGQQDGRKTYDSGGIYHIVITYHAIDSGLGVMFATVNGVPTGFYASWHDGAPDFYPAGLSFKGDMKQMQVFAGLVADNSDPVLDPFPDYGSVTLTDVVVDGVQGTADPLVADFDYTPSPVLVGDTVAFDASGDDPSAPLTHGGMAPYTYEWDFNNDDVVDLSTTDPADPAATRLFDTAGTYPVKLTVVPFRCTPQSVTKEITVEAPVADLAVVKSGPVWRLLGDTITYTYEVTNKGPASAAPTLVDDKCGTPLMVDVSPADGFNDGDANQDGLVDPGETWLYTCTYTPTWSPYQPLTNTATVTPVAIEDADLADNTDTYTLYWAVLRKDVLLYWQGHNVDYTDPNTEFTFVMSKGAVELGTFKIRESAPVYFWLSEGSYSFVEIDLPPGYEAPRTAWGWTAGPGARLDMSLENLIHFDLGVTKTGPASAAPGETITYSYTVTNSGPAAVAPVLSDDKCGTPVPTLQDGFNIGDLDKDGKVDAGEVWLFTATFTVPTDATGTSIVNIVTVKDAADDYGTGWKLGGDVNANNNSAGFTVPVVAPIVPQIGIVKTATPERFSEFSCTYVTYTFVVTNTGTMPVTLTRVTDDVYGTIYAAPTPNPYPIVLAPGASKTFIKKVHYKKDTGVYTNVATATAVDSGGRVATAQDDATVTVTDVMPKFCVSKKADRTSVPYTGGFVTYTFTVKNAGAEPVTLAKVVDDKIGVIYEGTSITLASGASKTFTKKFWVSGARGTYHVNTVTATVADNEGNLATATATARVLLTAYRSFWPTWCR